MINNHNLYSDTIIHHELVPRDLKKCKVRHIRERVQTRSWHFDWLPSMETEFLIHKYREIHETDI